MTTKDEALKAFSGLDGYMHVHNMRGGPWEVIREFIESVPVALLGVEEAVTEFEKILPYTQTQAERARMLEVAARIFSPAASACGECAKYRERFDEMRTDCDDRNRWALDVRAFHDIPSNGTDDFGAIAAYIKTLKTSPPAAAEVPRVEVELELPAGDTRTLRQWFQWFRKDEPGKIHLCLDIENAQPEILTGPCELGPGVWACEREPGSVYYFAVGDEGDNVTGKSRYIRVGDVSEFPAAKPAFAMPQGAPPRRFIARRGNEAFYGCTDPKGLYCANSCGGGWDSEKTANAAGWQIEWLDAEQQENQK